MEPRKVTLTHPIQRGEQVITELVFADRLKVKHIKNLSMQPTIGEVMKVVGAMCAQPPSVMEDIDVDDLEAVTEVFGSFLGKVGPAGSAE